MFQIKSRLGEIICLNINVIEAIYELEGGGSEIIVASGRRYTTLESLDKLIERLEIAQAFSK